MSERTKRVFAVALVAVLCYVIYAQLSGSPLVPGTGVPTPPPEPDTQALDELRLVASVQQVPLLGPGEEYDRGGRNLFQYGQPKPPPPSPEELEARRRAEEERLRAMEEEARRRAEEQRRLREEQERKAREAMESMQRQRDVPTEPDRKVRPPAPPINLRFVGVLGPPRSRIAVFLRQGEIVLGKKGEVIEGKYKVLSMGPESVLMGYTDPAYKDDSKQIVLGS